MLTKLTSKAALVFVAIALLSTVCLSAAQAQSIEEPRERATLQAHDRENLDLNPELCPEIELEFSTKHSARQAKAVSPGRVLSPDKNYDAAISKPPKNCGPPPPGPPFSHVFQLGDSYSAGVGSLPHDPAFEFGSHVCANPDYFRDEITAGIRIADDLDAEAIFAACSGAIAGTAYRGLSLADQVQQLVDAGLTTATNAGTDTLIVYSIGGNDLNVGGGTWVDSLITCLLPGECSFAPTANDWNALSTVVTNAHLTVTNAFPNATIRVVGYPLLANRAANSPCEVGPLVVDGANFGVTLDEVEADNIDAINLALNTRLSSVVDFVRASTSADIEFVNPADSSHPGACQWQSQTAHVAPWILNGSDISQNSFHPTEAGYQGIYEAVAENLGLTPQPLGGGPTAAYNCIGGALTSKNPDPWGARIPAGISVRGASTPGVLHGTILTDNVQTVDIVVDMLGEPLATADVDVYVEAPGGFPVPVALSKFCYEYDPGSDRGQYRGTATLRTGEPFTSIVAQLRNGNGDLIASGHSAIASVERIEPDNTLETLGIRLNNSALNELAEVAEFELERVLSDTIRDQSESIWIADVSDVDVQFSSLAPSAGLPNGGLQAQVTIDNLQVVVRGSKGCNWRLQQGPPISATVNLAFNPSAGNTAPLSVANVAIGFSGLGLDIHNAGTQEVQVCGSHVASLAADIASWNLHVPLTTALTLLNNTSNFWLVPVNDALAASIDSFIEEVSADLQDAAFGIDVAEAISIGPIQGDANGISVAVDVTLPGGPAPDDDPHQDISVSLTRSTAQGDAFDGSIFVELAALNRALALGARPYSIFRAGKDTDGDGYKDNQFLVDLDGNPSTPDVRISVDITAAPYLSRGPDGTACAGLCVEANLPPLRISIYEDQAGQWVWSRDAIVTPSAPVRLTSITQQPGAVFEFTWDTNVLIAASVVDSVDGTDTLAGFPAALWAIGASAVIPAEIAPILPSSIAPSEPLPAEIGQLNPTLSASQNDVAGNTDLQVLFDLDFTGADFTVPMCDGLTPTVWGTPNDDVIILNGNTADVIHGLGGNDLIEGAGGNDVICGGTGNGILDGEQGDDRVFGGPDDDFIRGGSGDDVSWAGGGDDYMIGDGGEDWLDGAGGNDTILGQDGSDTGLIGGFGDDIIEGGSGDDLIRGGDGDDTLKGGTDFQTFSVDRDRIEGGDGDDIIDGGDRNDEILGGAGADIIDGGAGQDQIWGGAGNDTIRGGPETIFPTDQDADEIWGEDGDDTINGGARDDDIRGGAGRDIINGGKGQDRIWGGAQDDTIRGGPESVAASDQDADDIWGEGGDDDIWGGARSDRIWGGDGDDDIWGGNKADEIRGGDGDDELFGDDGADDIWGDGGWDRADGGANIFDWCDAEVEVSC